MFLCRAFVCLPALCSHPISLSEAALVPSKTSGKSKRFCNHIAPWDPEGTSPAIFHVLGEGVKVFVLHTLYWHGIAETLHCAPRRCDCVTWQVLRPMNCTPIFVPTAIIRGSYLGYCKQILWPAFHNVRKENPQPNSERVQVAHVCGIYVVLHLSLPQEDVLANCLRTLVP